MAIKVKRATVNLDADLLEEAARALGTVGTTATLNRALDEVVRRRRLAELAATDFPELTLEGLEDVRRWRTADPEVIELIDTSAWALRQREPAVRRAIDQAILDGRAATCPPIVLELLHTARNVEDFRRWRGLLDALHPLPVGAAQWARALEVYEALAAQGGARPRSVKHQDLLAAAAAEAGGAVLVHYDEDYERIAAITGQPIRWAAPRGSV